LEGGGGGTEGSLPEGRFATFPEGPQTQNILIKRILKHDGERGRGVTAFLIAVFISSGTRGSGGEITRKGKSWSFPVRARVAKRKGGRETGKEGRRICDIGGGDKSQGKKLGPRLGRKGEKETATLSLDLLLSGNFFGGRKKEPKNGKGGNSELRGEERLTDLPSSLGHPLGVGLGAKKKSEVGR